MEWAEKHLEGEEYEEIFGEVTETDEKKTVALSLSLAAIDKMKRSAAAAGVSFSDYVEELIMKTEK